MCFIMFLFCGAGFVLISYAFPSSTPSVKLVLLDECDAMTKDAQFALRRGKKSLLIIYYIKYCGSSLYTYCMFLFTAVIEKYTKSTRFALICNHVNKIIPALQSRCTRFRFAPLDEVNVTDRLNHVINTEG